MLAAGPWHAFGMPLTELADGTTLHWHEWGDGPGVLVAGIAYGYPAMVRGLVDDLATDHRVVLPDLRGTGRSSRHGPYDLETDVADLRAVLEEAGPAAVAVGLGDGTLRTIELGAARPDLIEAVVLSGYAPLSRYELRGLEGLVASTPVLSALVRLLETDFRAAMRTMVETGSPDLDGAGVRERVDRAVEHCAHEAVVARMRGWIAADSEEAARALGDRLWVLHHPRNPWFPPELAERIPLLLPEAHVEEVADGALSRPDLTAAVVRRITAAG
jgi:pimeloyl-ACP methyl ester carboxylesterase